MTSLTTSPRLKGKPNASAVPTIGRTEVLFDTAVIDASKSVVNFLSAQAPAEDFAANYESMPLPGENISRISQAGFELNARSMTFEGATDDAAGTEEAVKAAVAFKNALLNAHVEFKEGSQRCKHLSLPMGDLMNVTFEPIYSPAPGLAVLDFEFGALPSVLDVLRVGPNDTIRPEVTFFNPSDLPAADTTIGGAPGGDLRLVFKFVPTRYSRQEETAVKQQALAATSGDLASIIPAEATGLQRSLAARDRLR